MDGGRIGWLVMENGITYLNKGGIMEFIISAITSLVFVMISNIMFFRKKNIVNVAFTAGLAFPFGAHASVLTGFGIFYAWVIIITASLMFPLMYSKYKLYKRLSLVYYLSMIAQFILYFSL